jgi:excinuclease ABC subunit A
VSQSVETALGMGNGTLIAYVVGTTQDDAARVGDHVFSRHLYSAKDGISYDDPSPNTFSFNTPYGACPECNGLGLRREIDPELVIPDRSLTIKQGGIAALGKPRDNWIFSQLGAVAEAHGFDFDTNLRALSDKQLDVILEGAGEKQFDIVYNYKDRIVRYRHRYGGIYEHIRHTYENTTSAPQRKWAEAFMRPLPCKACGGGRLKPESLAFRIGDLNIHDLVRLDLVSLKEFFAATEFEERQGVIAEPIVKEIRERLDFLIDVGVGYLNLDRTARTLSGGESQRIRLATQIGTQLTGVLYVLDEPSIGLHPRDNGRLIDSLKTLRDLDNSVLVVEHDREMIEAADFVVDLGPGAGELGGHVVAAGAPAVLANGAPHAAEDHETAPAGAAEGTSENPAPSTSLTAAYLSGARQIGVPAERRSGNGRTLELLNARGHNLKGDTLAIPLGTFVCVTGVSGSGKSSLINQTLYPILARHFFNAKTVPLPYDQVEGLEHVDKVIDIDQSPIGRTPRSNPATYTGLFSHIRDLFALLPESKIRGYKPGRFSFNVKGGRCETCKGAGIVKLEMNFLPDVYVECETCRGRRYNPETLEVKYSGKSIADVMAMTVSEALAFFESVPRIKRKLKTLASVGLGYIRLGQQSTTLSGGEAQRVKLAKELSRPGTGSTLYILDEPTTGLHFEDIRYLLNVLRALVKKGNTVVVIEHNMDVVKVADHVIDLGPDGGDAGGRILFAGAPEDVAQSDTFTALFLREELERTARFAAEVEEDVDLAEMEGDDGPDDDNSDDDDEIEDEDDLAEDEPARMDSTE